MVEGPGTTRNGNKARQLLNYRLLNITCTCNDKVLSMNQSNNNNNNNNNGSMNNNGDVAISKIRRHQEQDMPWFTNRHLSQVLTIGKELYLIFANILHDDGTHEDNNDNNNSDGDDLALRLHFGMNGSLHVNKLTSLHHHHHDDNNSNNLKKRKNNDTIPTLTLTFETNMVLQTFCTTVQGPIKASAPKLKFNNFSLLDVCSPTSIFQPLHVLSKIRNNSNHSTNIHRIISDVLLDQNIYPGVGNIIKIEGLHHARIHPKQCIGTLSEKDILRVIHCCREYAYEWYQKGFAPRKCVYNQSKCVTCTNIIGSVSNGNNNISTSTPSTIVMQRIGISKRTTFWCLKCQPFQQQQQQQQQSANNDKKSIHNPYQQKANQQQQALLIVPTLRRVCPTHGPDTFVTKRVRQVGKNHSRLFHACKAKKCSYFAWADLHFPKCTECNQRCSLLMSKTERTGGKWFFTCISSRGKSGARCKFFKWAEQQDLQMLGDINPLL
jgi:formamidopyrimidine-DNA glycosylase